MPTPESDHQFEANNRPLPSRIYAWYVVGVLFLAQITSFVDRLVISLLVDPIKSDLQITDTQISLLLGFAFAIFYTIMGFPIARLADRWNRKHIMSIGIFLWSLMTASCGLARSYSMLFVARIGVGVGEASLAPSAFSTIADYFPRNKLGRATSVFTSANYIGTGLAFVIGGIVISFASEALEWNLPVIGIVKPWQLTFLVVALPGFLVLPLLMTLREPARRALTSEKSGLATGTSLSDFWRFVSGRRKVIFGLFASLSILTVMGYGSAVWIPTYFIRVHGWTATQSGIYFGGAYAVCGILGAMTGALASEELVRRGYRDGILRIVVVSALLTLPALVLPPYVGGAMTDLALYSFAVYASAMPWGIGIASLQLITPNQFRAQISALLLFSINLVGLGMGPTLVALFTDYVFKEEAAVGQSLSALAILTVSAAVAAAIYGLKPYRDALDLAEGRS